MWDDINIEELCLLKYLVNNTGPKNTVENIKHLKIQHFLTTKIQQLWPELKKTTQIFEIQTPQNTPLIPVCKDIKSTTWVFFNHSVCLAFCCFQCPLLPFLVFSGSWCQPPFISPKLLWMNENWNEKRSRLLFVARFGFWWVFPIAVCWFLLLFVARSSFWDKPGFHLDLFCLLLLVLAFRTSKKPKRAMQHLNGNIYKKLKRATESQNEQPKLFACFSFWDRTESISKTRTSNEEQQ